MNYSMSDLKSSLAEIINKSHEILIVDTSLNIPEVNMDIENRLKIDITFACLFKFDESYNEWRSIFTNGREVSRRIIRITLQGCHLDLAMVL